MMQNADLPNFAAEQFDLKNPPECDIIMKGGITSGIVYPYAILQIATKHKMRSIGGTSAGAIAAAFAAAAEYGRQNGHPEAFITLKHYCDQLPTQLQTLFQPSPVFDAALDTAKSLKEVKSIGQLTKIVLRSAALPAVVVAVAAGVVSAQLYPGAYPTTLAVLLGGVGGGLFGAVRWGSDLQYFDP